MFDVHFDESTATLEVTVEGFWDDKVRADFEGVYGLAIRQCRKSHRPFVLLVDARRFSVQSKQVVAGILSIHQSATTAKRAPTAVVVESALVKLQAERTITGDNVRVFLEMAEAQAWIGSWRSAASAGDGGSSESEL